MRFKLICNIVIIISLPFVILFIALGDDPPIELMLVEISLVIVLATINYTYLRQLAKSKLETMLEKAVGSTIEIHNSSATDNSDENEQNARNQRGALIANCQKCNTNELSVKCPHCQKDDLFVLNNGNAICDCGHQINGATCNCGAFIHGGDFSICREKKDNASTKAQPISNLQGGAVGFATVIGFTVVLQIFDWSFITSLVFSAICFFSALFSCASYNLPIEQRGGAIIFSLVIFLVCTGALVIFAKPAPIDNPPNPQTSTVSSVERAELEARSEKRCAKRCENIVFVAIARNTCKPGLSLEQCKASGGLVGEDEKARVIRRCVDDMKPKDLINGTECTEPCSGTMDNQGFHHSCSETQYQELEIKDELIYERYKDKEVDITPPTAYDACRKECTDIFQIVARDCSNAYPTPQGQLPSLELLQCGQNDIPEKCQVVVQNGSRRDDPDHLAKGDDFCREYKNMNNNSQNTVASTAQSAPGQLEPTPTVTQSKGIGVSYEQVTEHLSKYFLTLKEYTINGRPHYLFTGRNNETSMLIITGANGDIHSAELMVMFSKNLEVFKGRSLLADIFLIKTVPELEDPGAWLSSVTDRNFKAAQRGEREVPVREAEFGEKLVKVEDMKIDGSLRRRLSVEPKKG